MFLILEELRKLEELRELNTILLSPIVFANMTIVFNSSATIGCDNTF